MAIACLTKPLMNYRNYTANPLQIYQYLGYESQIALKFISELIAQVS